jgi:hypothetical protein
VGINVIHPCDIRTAWTEDSAESHFGKDNAVQPLKESRPFKCLGEPGNVAYCVMFLASEESRLVNAAYVVLDGALLGDLKQVLRSPQAKSACLCAQMRALRRFTGRTAKPDSAIPWLFHVTSLSSYN